MTVTVDTEHVDQLLRVASRLADDPLAVVPLLVAAVHEDARRRGSAVRVIVGLGDFDREDTQVHRLVPVESAGPVEIHDQSHLRRFVRVLADSSDPGARLVLELRGDLGESVAMLREERVLPEQVNNPDARHAKRLAMIDVTDSDARWLRKSIDEMLSEVDFPALLSTDPNEVRQ